MKKFKILACFLIAGLLVTGCGKESEGKKEETNAKDVVNQALEKVKSLDSFHVSTTMTMQFSVDGESVSDTTSMEEDYDVKNHKKYTFLTSAVENEQYETQTYTEYNDNQAVAYTSSDDTNWYKTTASESMPTLYDELKVLSNSDDIKKTKEKDNITTYEIIFNQETTKTMLKDLDLELPEENVEYKNTVVQLEIDKNQNIVYYSTVLSVTLDGQTVTINMDSRFSEFNSVGDLEIPQEIIDNAKSIG